jgi:glycosyltransferase involved in cell wall biosynthesis
LAELRAATGLEILRSGRRATPLLWTWLGHPRIELLMRSRVDIVHAASLGYPVATGRPYVVTIHDLGPLTHPQYFANTRPWVMRKSLDQAVRQAAAIVCVSNWTRDEVIEVAGNSVADRLHVVHEGISLAAGEEADWAQSAAAWNLPADVPFILAAGKLSPRKNIDGVIAALGVLKANFPHHLVLAGSEGWGFAVVHEAIMDHGLSDRVHFAGHVSDAELRALYRRASVYVHPSHYEGFGLTVLEAMAAGTPVITSNVSALPEIAGDAAFLVSPGECGELVDALERVLGDAGLAETMRARGLERAQSFSWRSNADAMTRIYRSIV